MRCSKTPRRVAALVLAALALGWAGHSLAQVGTAPPVGSVPPEGTEIGPRAPAPIADPLPTHPAPVAPPNTQRRLQKL